MLALKPGPDLADGHLMLTPRGADRRKATRRERYEILMRKAELASARGSLRGAETLKRAALKALEGPERRSGCDRRK